MKCECCEVAKLDWKNIGGDPERGIPYMNVDYCSRCEQHVCRDCRIDCHGDDVPMLHHCVSNPRVKRTRCHVCEQVYTRDDLWRIAQETGKAVAACPSCGDIGVPHDPDDDTTITINTHDLRILTIWASNWAEKHKLMKGLSPVLRRLRRQLPGMALTLADEVQELRNRGFEATMHTESGEQTYPPPENQRDLPVDPHDPPNG